MLELDIAFLEGFKGGRKGGLHALDEGLVLGYYLLKLRFVYAVLMG